MIQCILAYIFLEKHSEADILECVWAVLTWCCPASSAVAQELDLFPQSHFEQA